MILLQIFVELYPDFWNTGFFEFPIIRNFLLVPLIHLLFPDFSSCFFHSNRTNYSNFSISFERNSDFET